MTLLELQPHVEAALVALEWDLARARWRQGLINERSAISRALKLAGQYGIEEGPLLERLAQIDEERKGDVTADRVSVHPLRSVPMDVIAAAVVRRVIGIPPDIPVMSVKVPPSPDLIADAIAAIAQKWQHVNGPAPESTELTHV